MKLPIRWLLFILLAGAAVGADVSVPPPVRVAPRESRPCAQCHPAQATPQIATSMAHAMETVAECVSLREHPLLTFKEGNLSYTIKREGGSSVYSVTNGSETLSAPIGWSFGLGMAGQTYVYVLNGEYYESRVSFYEKLNGLDLTMGAARSKPVTIAEALGRRMSHRESMECFDCHATHSIADHKLTVGTLTAGVQCERCHGSAESHLAAFKTGNMGNAGMKKLGGMTSEEVNDFCGQCHRTWSQISATGPKGVGNVRFQPYRITNSKCYDADDARIRCIACHDPHNNLMRNQPAYYDGKCRGCHSADAKNTSAKVCRVGQENCAGCHMPKTALPGAHHDFTDHLIRIVRPGEHYPD